MVKPRSLYLIQDGPRNGVKTDTDKIEACRKIVDDIDWECTVNKNYSDVNLGCGRRPYTGIKWLFEHVSEAIILEDDCVPEESFFSFCEEMLDRYRCDLRVGIISGLNYFQHYDFGGFSYGFVKTGAIWGWATWKDRWEKSDFELSGIKNEYIRNLIGNDITPKRISRKRIQTWSDAKKKIDNEKKVSFWDYQWGFSRHMNSWLSIVPEFNQITNIGIGVDATHSGKDKSYMPKKVANFFFMETSQLTFPLKHPSFVLPDRNYDTKYYNIIYPNYFERIRRKMMRCLYQIFHRRDKS